VEWLLARPAAEYDLDEGLLRVELNVEDETAVLRSKFSSPKDVYAWDVFPMEPASREQISPLEQRLNDGLVFRAKCLDSDLVIGFSDVLTRPLDVQLLRCSHDNSLLSQGLTRPS
jgi:hypothetical protein